MESTVSILELQYCTTSSLNRCVSIYLHLAQGKSWGQCAPLSCSASLLTLHNLGRILLHYPQFVIGSGALHKAAFQTPPSVGGQTHHQGCGVEASGHSVCSQPAQSCCCSEAMLIHVVPGGLCRWWTSLLCLQSSGSAHLDIGSRHCQLECLVRLYSLLFSKMRSRACCDIDTAQGRAWG